MKKNSSFLTLALAFLIFATNILGLLPQKIDAGVPDYQLIASKSGLVEQTDFAPVELSLKNNTGASITIGDIDVQRVMLPFEEDTMETIAQIPSSILDACESVVGATDASGPDGGCINIDGEWYRETLALERDDILPKPTIAPGETAVIAEISTGMPTSWRGWYGGGWVDLFAWIEITPDGGSEIDFEGGFVRHFIDYGSMPPDVQFLQDNGDGSATFIITGIQSGLKKENFEVYQRIDRTFGGFIGTIVSVTEREDGAYVLIWRHTVQNHNGICIAAHDDEGNNVLDWGNLPIITITSSAIPREFTTTDGKKITSNIDDIKDLANTEIDLVFTAASYGSISFAPGLNLFDYQEELMQLAEFLSVTYDKSKNEMKASVNTKSLTFLANHGATIKFFDVSEKMGFDELTEENFMEVLDILVYDDDELVTDFSDYFDWDEVTYDPETDTLTLPVNHFTEYVLGESSELPETGAAIIGAVSVGILSLGGYALYKKRRKN